MADRKTFARRPPRVRLKRWARRVALLLVLLALAAASVPGWYYWRWRAEQPVILELEQPRVQFYASADTWSRPGRYFPRPWQFMLSRVKSVRWDQPDFESVRRVNWQALGSLADLRVSNAGLTDEALWHFRGRREIYDLDLRGNPLSGSGLAYFADNRGLMFLDLRRTQLDDAGLARVRGFRALQQLDLDQTRITDAGMAHLGGLTSLRILSLSGTAVTDEGLSHLGGLRSLQFVWVNGTRVTEQGKANLRRSLSAVTFSQ